MNFYSETVIFNYGTGDPKKTDHLLALEGAKERLRLFKADLSIEESFDSAVDGCDGVFHVAFPVSALTTDSQVYLSYLFLHCTWQVKHVIDLPALLSTLVKGSFVVSNQIDIAMLSDYFQLFFLLQVPMIVSSVHIIYSPYWCDAASFGVIGMSLQTGDVIIIIIII